MTSFCCTAIADSKGDVVSDDVTEFVPAVLASWVPVEATSGEVVERTGTVTSVWALRVLVDDVDRIGIARA